MCLSLLINNYVQFQITLSLLIKYDAYTTAYFISCVPVHLLFTHNLLKSAMLDKNINYSTQLIMGYKNNLRSA